MTPDIVDVQQATLEVYITFLRLFPASLLAKLLRNVKLTVHVRVVRAALHLKRFSQPTINDQDDVFFLLPLLETDKSWWCNFLMNNECTCMNFLFLWLCTEKHDSLFIRDGGTLCQSFIFI